MDNMHGINIPIARWDVEESSVPQSDYSTYSERTGTRVLFKDLEQHLINYISQADVVVGCVAWLTSEPILQALAKTKGVSIIVQKEDFLRPDIAVSSQKRWARNLRKLYNALPQITERHLMPGLLGQMSAASDPTLDPVRCVGNYNTEKAPAFPRSHHKFVIFAKLIPGKYEYGPDEIVLLKVWTGSYNFTKNASASFENAVVLEDPRIVNAYYEEYAQVAALSEPLDWGSDWVSPEWRIGT